MHPYLFFYFLGGLTFIPLTLLLVFTVLWIRLPAFDPSLPRPTDLPPPHTLLDQIERDNVKDTHSSSSSTGDGSSASSVSTSTGVDKNRSIRKRRSALHHRKSDQHLKPQAMSSSSPFISGTNSINNTASAPGRLNKTTVSDNNDNSDDSDCSSDDQDNHGEEDTVADDDSTATLSLKAVAAREPDVLMQADPNLNKEGYVRMTRVPRLGPAAESISDYMTNILFQPKNARPKDSYYAVLRYDTLFLYESDQQRDCKSVVPMNLYEVKIFPKSLPDNEVFNKEHPIQIKRKPDAPVSASAQDNGQDEYYIFIHTPVVKEDWYLALLYASKLRKPGTKQKIQDKAQFDPEAIQNHIRIIHSDKHHEHTRWFNSFLGRIFLGVYKTKKIEEIFIQKITRKTLKLKRPSFLGEIKVRSFQVGHSIPYITRTKLHELAPNGELSSEFHLSYRGGLRVEIEVDVGLGLATLKPVKVTIVLAVLVKSISGMMTLKIKAPPTNRFWIGFQEPPEMDIVIEPIVADKAIKLNMVLTAIESKIREAMVEAIVLPNMDDTPFFDSHGRGGIFEGDEDISSETPEESDADSMLMGKAGKSGRRKSAGDRRGSVSSFNSEHAPPKLDGSDRKSSWSSAGTESDIDPESAPIATTPPSTIYLQPNNSSSTNAVSMTNTTTPIAATMAAKFKRFSQAHFPYKSTESLAEASKLNTKPTVATSIATAIRTSPAGTSHSVNSSNPGKLLAIPKLNVISDIPESAGPRIFASSPSNGPAKKDSSSSLRRLASLESPASDDSESSTDSADNAATPTGNDPVYQSLQSPVEPIDNKEGAPRQTRRTEFDASPRSNASRVSDATNGQADGNGKETTSNYGNGMTSSSSHIGIAGILDGKRSRTNSISGTAMTVQSNLANLFSERRNKKNQNKGDNSAGDGNSNNSNSNTDQDATKATNSNNNNNSNSHTKDHGRKNSGDSLLSFKAKKDLLLKKITSNNSTNSSHSEEEHDGANLKSLSSKFSLDDIRVGGLLGHRRRGSLPAQNGKAGQKQTAAAADSSPLHTTDQLQDHQGQQEQQEHEQGSPQRQVPGRRGLERSMSSTAVLSSRNVDLYPLGKPFEGSSPSTRFSPTTPDETMAGQPLSSTVASSRTSPFASSGSTGSSRSSSSSSSTSRYLQEKSQAALGATKAWMKRSLDDRRMSDDDPLLSGKMRLD
ncbi:hypothetical protein EC957_000987 [Mortierella hygrophila]|uniref:SMP-LTD domain-containing protein n=1 Tax=Mortierella hygrophila TaxID=979708 RepID=A0A9P6F5C9_9FUNG|nr:hypothetical protein EC957_000987 [Mortierella hygrophila]